MKKALFLTALALTTIMAGCKNADRAEVKIDYTEFHLDNGLHVILQQDHSDPIVAVAIQYHVGSAREKTGRTGFAHFFEHMLFQRSENLPRNAFFQKIAALGGDFKMRIYDDSKTFIVDDAVEKCVAEIKAILKMPSPYAHIPKLPGLISQFTEAYMAVLESMSGPIYEAMEDARKRVFDELDKKPYKDELSTRFHAMFTELKAKADRCNRRSRTSK